MANKQGSGGGILDGLTNLIEKLGELAQTGEQLKRSGQFQSPGGTKAMYGFNVKVGIGGEEVHIQPFGNIRKDAAGRTVVNEDREPAIDVLDESDHVLVLAEVPGVSPDEVQIELHGDILSLRAWGSQVKYAKELELPGRFSVEDMTHSCRNGILEIRLAKRGKK